MLTKQTAAELRHTLRTPINHISGYSEILLEDLDGQPEAPRAIGLLHIIQEEARRNLEAIQNVLTGDADGLPADALTELQRRMSPPIERMRDAAEALGKILPETMLPDLSRIAGAIRELAAEIEAPSAVETKERTAVDAVCKQSESASTGSILVVDDNEANRDMLSRRLTRDGYSAALANDGETALEMIRGGRFDLVLLDMVMPGISGLRVIEIMKADPDLCRTPVILISAVDDMDTVARCIELGAEDYLFKPVNPVLLRARVRSTLERRRAEEAMRRKQELESIGALAAGVAHDFNNLLTGVLGNACMLQDSMAPEDTNRVFVDEIITSSERAADLTRQLLAYAGKGRYRLEPLDVSRMISEATATIRALLPANVELHCELRRVPVVRGDSDQLRQVILNLVTNAGEAVGTAAGSVTIATGMESVAEKDSALDPGLNEVGAGDYVYVEVCDTGQGMDPADTAKIFDPFYTTKFFGRGLGLAAVAGIVRMHGGGMRVATVKQQGSAFRVLIPVHAQARPLS